MMGTIGEGSGGSGYGVGGVAFGKAAKRMAAPVAPGAAAPSVSRVAAADEKAQGGLSSRHSGRELAAGEKDKKEAKSDHATTPPAQSQAWHVIAGTTAAVTAPAALVASLRAALAGGGCALSGKSLTLRLTVNARAGC